MTRVLRLRALFFFSLNVVRRDASKTFSIMRRKKHIITHLNYLEVNIMKNDKYYVIDGIRYSEEEYKLVFGRETK